VYANFLSIFFQGKKSNEKSLAFFGEYANTSPLCHFLALNNKAHKIANIYIYIPKRKQQNLSRGLAKK